MRLSPLEQGHGAPRLGVPGTGYGEDSVRHQSSPDLLGQRSGVARVGFADDRDLTRGRERAIEGRERVSEAGGRRSQELLHELEGRPGGLLVPKLAGQRRQAQKDLGVMYEKGLGVAQDRDEAIAWYRKAAAQGNTEAQLALKRLNAQ